MNDLWKNIQNAIIVVAVLLFFTVLPISPIIFRNIQLKQYILSGLTLSLYISLLYSLVTPGLVGIVRRNDYNNFHKSIIIIFAAALVFYMGYLQERATIIQIQNQYYEIFITITVIILLFFNSYKEEVDTSSILEREDKKMQGNIVKYSKNLKLEDIDDE